MKSKAIGAVVLLVLIVIGIVACTAWHPSIDPIQPPAPASFDAASVARGRQLAAVGDCMSCHTAAQGRPYAGGAPLQTPFGTLYSTNITPDAQTGIGAWSVAAFTRAMREGVARDGHLLYPAFPYPHFTHMTDADIQALYAFLMTRTPVNAKPPDNALHFPLNFRPLVAGWNLLFLDKGELPAAGAANDHDAQWLRGRYLVEGPGHCAACHTPMNMFGAERSGSPYAGGLIEGWNAPPLNALRSGPRPWTADQLSSYLRTGLAAEHGAAAGPMRVVTQQLADVNETDIRAMTTYLLALDANPRGAPPAEQAAAAAAAPAAPADSPSLRGGAALFSGSCASCHGAEAPMRTLGDRPSLALSSTVNQADPRNMINLILQGIPAEPGSPAYMPPYDHMLTDAQVADVANYVRTTIAHQPAWTGLQDNVAAIRKEAQK
jgi:mono/diheme cytochrome c family protein